METADKAVDEGGTSSVTSPATDQAQGADAPSEVVEPVVFTEPQIITYDGPHDEVLCGETTWEKGKPQEVAPEVAAYVLTNSSFKLGG